MLLPKLLIGGLSMLEPPRGFPKDYGSSEVVPDSWTVWLKDNVTSTASKHAAWASSVHQKDPGGLAGIQETYEWTLIDMKGYMGKFTKKTAEIIRDSEEVESVSPTLNWDPDLGYEADGDREYEVTLRTIRQELEDPINRRDDYQIDDPTSETDEEVPTQSDSETAHPPTETGLPDNTKRLKNGNLEQTNSRWGLSRISNTKNCLYRYNSSAGADTYIYILDTGVDALHPDFEGRVEKGGDMTLDRLTASNITQLIPQDKIHGTHVASIAAGAEYGVAKKATIVDVKVFREPREEHYDGSNAPVRGVSWAISDIVAKGRVGRAVINISWGRKRNSEEDGEVCKALTRVIEKALDAGVPVVINAGDDDISAENRCPANTERAITVGASGRSNDRTNHPLWQSSWGPIVDIFAPGEWVKGALASTDKLLHLSGTAYAAPHVSGVIAYLLAMEGPRTPDEIWERVRGLARTGVVKHRKGEPDRFLYNGAEK